MKGNFEETVEREKKILNDLLEKIDYDQKILKEIKQKYFGSEKKEDLIKYTIVNFITEYNTFKRVWNNKIHRKLIKKLIENYNNKKIIDSSLKIINETIT